MDKSTEKDDILFEQLKKAKRRKRRKVFFTVLTILLIVGAAGFYAVRTMRERVLERFQQSVAEVKTYEAQVGRISTAVSGSGTLSYTGHEDIEVPDGVEVTQLLVSAGDTVKAGDVIATVDVNSVLTALADTQSELTSLDKQIDSAKNDTVSSSLTTAVSGRVKKIFAEAGDNVVDVMTAKGALALISLDGLMTVSIDAQLEPGSAVTVVTGEKSYPGTVESCIAGTSVITLTDDGPEYRAQAQVQDAEGRTLGTGTLNIRNAISVTGYAGTVNWLNVKENQTVYSGSSIFTLTNTQYTANYDTLLRDRAEKEKTVNTLIELMRTGSICAEFDGIVTAANDPNKASDAPSSAATSYLGGSAASSALATIAPNAQFTVSVSVDETDILSLEVGQEAQVKVSSIGDEVYPGIVTEISRIGSGSSGVTAYSAVVTLDKKDQMLSGMSASVDIQIRGVDDVVLIPVDALRQTRNTYYVFTTYDEEAQEYGGMVEVTVGESNSSYVEIMSGLKPGDTVCYTEKNNNNPFAMWANGMSGMGNFGGNSGNNRSSRGGSSGSNNSFGGSGFSGRPGMGG